MLVKVCKTIRDLYRAGHQSRWSQDTFRGFRELVEVQVIVVAQGKIVLVRKSSL